MMGEGRTGWRWGVAWACALALIAAPVSSHAAKGKADKREKKEKAEANFARDGGRLDIKPMARIEFEPIKESSGLARSTRHPGVYWTHNDSGDWARIFAVRADGSVVHPAGVALKDYQGILVEGAVNVDWEDIAFDGQGRLVIADSGDNLNIRRNLMVYIVAEPDPERDLKTAVVKKIPVYYPERHFTPGEPKNFDCEAVFVAGGRIHLLTKHHSDTRTSLYRLESEWPDRPNPLKLVGEAEIGDMVTAADASPDGRRLAVLTCSAVWVFEAAGGEKDGNYLKGAARWLPIKAGQCEAVCFDGPDKLLIGNEKGKLFSVPLEWLKPYQKAEER